jgi:hypothetical protein
MNPAKFVNPYPKFTLIIVCNYSRPERRFFSLYCAGHFLISIRKDGQYTIWEFIVIALLIKIDIPLSCD